MNKFNEEYKQVFSVTSDKFWSKTNGGWYSLKRDGVDILQNHELFDDFGYRI